MTYYVNRGLNRTFREDLKYSYNIDNLKRSAKYIQEDIETLQNMLKDVMDQAQKVINTEFFNILELERRKGYGDNKIKYTLRVYKVPKADTSRNTWELDYKSVRKWEGKDRNKAIAEAEKLKRELKCELNYIGFRR